MAIIVEATYETGVLRLDKPLPLEEREKVRLTIEPTVSPILEAYGIMGWTGDAVGAFGLSHPAALSLPPCPAHPRMIDASGAACSILGIPSPSFEKCVIHRAGGFDSTQGTQ